MVDKSLGLRLLVVVRRRLLLYWGCQPQWLVYLVLHRWAQDSLCLVLRWGMGILGGHAFLCTFCVAYLTLNLCSQIALQNGNVVS